MGYKTPTSRKSKKGSERLNLIPILDAVFIFIFFLLMSTQFIKIFEIGSDIPIISNSKPKKPKKKPLALTVTIHKGHISVLTGVPSQLRKKVGKTSDGKYDLNTLHDFLVNLKKSHLSEETVILEPMVDLKYEEIIEIMDSIRSLRNTDGTFFKKDKDGIDVQLKTLFSKIIFGNLMS